MIRSQMILQGGEGTLEKRFSFLILTLVIVEVTQVVEAMSRIRMIRAYIFFDDNQVLFAEDFSFLILTARPKIRSQIVKKLSCLNKCKRPLINVLSSLKSMSEIFLALCP